MVKSIINRLVSMFGRRHSSKWQSDMLTWAQTEYKKDWQFAYQHMLDHNGQPPKRHITGVTL